MSTRVVSGAEVQKLIRRAKGRPRHVAGVLNKTELAFLEYLKLRYRNGDISWFTEKPFSLKLADNLWYRPDFMYMESDDLLTVVDVKGRKKNEDGSYSPYIEDDALVKIKAVARLFPLRFVIAWPLAPEMMAWSFREVGA